MIPMMVVMAGLLLPVQPAEPVPTPGCVFSGGGIICAGEVPGPDPGPPTEPDPEPSNSEAESPQPEPIPETGEPTPESGEPTPNETGSIPLPEDTPYDTTDAVRIGLIGAGAAGVITVAVVAVISLRRVSTERRPPSGPPTSPPSPQL